MKKILLTSFLLTSLSILIITLFVKNNEKLEIISEKQETIVEEIIYPIDNFLERITKKSFGDYIDPRTSPVKPERFTGWHTGVDVEYGDVDDEVLVVAVCDGIINYSGWVSGYGGVVVLKCQLKEKNYYLVYGHLGVESLTNKTELLKGEVIGKLGNGFTHETDFERKHLHFGVHKNSMNLKGYVEKENELNNWVDPINFIQSLVN